MINPYEVMYDAKMDVYRWSGVTTDNITKQVKSLVASNRKCRYSASSQTDTGAEIPSIVNSHKLFCGINENIKEGDDVVVTLRTGKVITVRLGECHPYTYQWQCEIKRDDKA